MDAIPVAPRDSLPSLTRVSLALLLLTAVGASLGMGVELLRLGGGIDAFIATNVMAASRRKELLGFGATGGTLLVGGAIAFAWWGRNRRDPATAMLHLAHRVAPLGIVGLLPLSFHWELWRDRDLQFLALTTLMVIGFGAGLRSAFAAGPLPAEIRIRQHLQALFVTTAQRFPRFTQALPLSLVCLGALSYAIYFSVYTCAWHRAVRSGYDLAIENNILWNLIHGSRPLFKSSPVFGPTFTHFGHHATLFAFVIAPFYALHQGAETLLVVQSVLMGGAAIPLFLFARRHLSSTLACCLALLYLLYPPVHGANLFEFHYIPLGTFFLWTTLYLLETRRDWGALLTGILTLSVREDVAASMAIVGAYFLISGKRPRAGLVVMATSALYFVTIKMAIMPRIAAEETFTYVYQGLLPRGENSFGAVLKTVFSNPAFTFGTLVDQTKLVYLLQLLVPLAFIPLRHSTWGLFVVPGFLFTLLSTGYSPTISIHFQYTAHWTSFLFISLVLALAALAPIRRQAAVGCLVLGMLICSFQYGTVLQTNTAWGGPIPYKFRVTGEDRNRRTAMDALMKDLPANAKVASSAFVVPQLSSREDDYSMTNGIYDATYIAFPSEPADFIGNEQQTVTDLLGNGSFGVVSVHPPFALAKRGHDTTGNATLLARLR